MNIAKVIEERQKQWSELEAMCERLDVTGKDRRDRSAGILRFASLYRSACADLALADAYQLPPSTVAYLHRLVARAHNRLYRAGRINPIGWAETVFRTAPRQIFLDPCVRVVALLFFGIFSLSALAGAAEGLFPEYVSALVGDEMLQQLEESYDTQVHGSFDHYVTMAGYYIMHNTGIGLKCFAYGVLIIPCLFEVAYNGAVLGAMFGYMARPDIEASNNFFHFVTAHGPFELTAIALAGGAGLRLGMGLFYTKGLARFDSMRQAATQAVPIMVASACLFFLAAMTEGFISPSPLPYLFKISWAILSAGLISFYFVVLGFPEDSLAARRARAQESYDPLGVDDQEDPLAA